MHEINLLEAFASYKVRPVRRARSAMTSEGDLVVSCWYAGFKKAQVDILKYEEDLSGQTSEIATALRRHLAEALSNECDVRVIVAVGTIEPKVESEAVAPARTTYYARKDLVGRVSSFDGERFIVEFRRTPSPVQGKLSKGALLTRRASLAGR
jgi:hypothetical protein